MSYRAKVFVFFFFLIPLAKGQEAGDSTLMLLEGQVDSIVNASIGIKAFPGCVLYVAWKGESILFKSYGFHTYDSIFPVKKDDLYDLASLTKITGSTLALMKLYELGLLRLDAPLKEYVSGFEWNKRGKATIRECLTHQAGFHSWIRYYQNIQRGNGKYKRRTIANYPSEKYPYELAPGKYLHRDFYRQIKAEIRKSDFDPERGYQYSDLFFYLVPEIVNNLTGITLTEFLRYHFYDSLASETPMYNPLDYFPKERVVPTEIDTFFRMSLIHGRVHDEGAILMHGVSGNAGQFAKAEDLAKVWQMLLNGGEYEGKRYLHPATIDLFTSYQYPAQENRRALGFDKPLLKYDPMISSVAEAASTESFGHTGFTGTIVWTDPTHDLLFIFLTNRVYPSRAHKFIYTFNIRPTIHALFYEFLERHCEEISGEAEERRESLPEH